MMDTQKTHDGQKVTIYVNNDMGFGLGTVEARLFKTGTKKYAQYDNAAYCQYKPKGARKMRGMVATYKPWLVVLEGWGLPKFNNWDPPKSGAGVETQSGKFSTCDDRWELSGDIFVADVVSQTGAKVVADYRYTHGFNTHDRYSSRWGWGSTIAARLCNFYQERANVRRATH